MEKLLSVNGNLYPVAARSDAINAVAEIIENSAYYRRRVNRLYATTDDSVLVEYAFYHAAGIIGAAIKYGNCRQKDVVVTTVYGGYRVDANGVIREISQDILH